jgi:phenylpyruvate tautomerase PptA (4-oxalocrotonate tautomerase family)
MIGNVILLLPLQSTAQPKRKARQRTVRVAGQISAALVKQARFTPIVEGSSATVQPLAGVSHAHLHCHGRESTSIAAAITVAHNAQTGAPRFFAQVLFSAASEGDHFVGGRENTAPEVYEHGLVREGRSNEIKQALMSQILQEIAQIVDISAEDVWI